MVDKMVGGSISTSDLPLYDLDSLSDSFGRETILDDNI